MICQGFQVPSGSPFNIPPLTRSKAGVLSAQPKPARKRGGSKLSQTYPEEPSPRILRSKVSSRKSLESVVQVEQPVITEVGIRFITKMGNI